MDVKFLRGLSTAYQNIASKDSKTFYFTTDDNKLYLGDVLLSNEITLVAFNELEERVKALEDAGFQAQIDAINETLKSIATSDTVEAIDNRLKAVEADYLKGADKTELEGKITAHETAVNTKFNDYRTSADQDVIDNAQTKALNDYKAEMVETLKGYQTTIPAETYDAYGAAATAESNAKGYADGLISAEVTRSNKYVDDKFADANLAQYTTEQEVKDIVDGVIAAAVEGDAIDNLTELVEYLNTHEGVATQMATDIGTLKTKVQTIEGKPAYGIENADITNWDNEIGAKALAQGVKDTIDNSKVTWDKAGTAVQPGDLAPYAKTADISADIAKGVEAQGWGNHANQGYAKTADISEDIAKGVEANALALEINGRLPDVIGHLTTKDTIDSADLVNDKVITKAKLEDSVQASLALADRALQAHQDISHLAKQADLESLQNQHDTFENKINTSAVFTSGITADLVAQITTNKETIAQNAQTCQSNFNTISEQLTWGSF